MLVSSLILATLAVLLAWPVPLVLAKAEWPSRSPGIALGLWQAIALSGGLSMIGALVTFGLTPFNTSVLLGLLSLGPLIASGPLPAGTGLIHVFALSSAALLAAHLLLNLLTTTIRTERQRRRHRSLVELLSTPLPDRPGTHIIDSPAPVAYCLPGARTVTVLSEGLVNLLDAEQLEAVIAHERAHLRQQHHVVLVAFESWRGALPWFPIATRAQVAVSLLVEMLADDQSRRFTDRITLAETIAIVGSHETDSIVRRRPALATAAAPAGPAESVPRAISATDGRLDAAGPVPSDAVSRRVERLLNPEPPLSLVARGIIVSSGALLLAIPIVLLLAS